MFRDRVDAGRQLATFLKDRGYENPIIFALVRGGIPVGFQIAQKINAPLEPLVIRKLGVPGMPELGFGAIAPEGVLTADETIIDELGLDHEQIQAVKEKEEQEMLRRIKEYGAKTDFGDLSNNVAIIVDDGIATGVSMLAAIRFLKKFSPKQLVVAVPVCPEVVTNLLQKETTEYICLQKEKYFGAVGQFYDYFEQASDAEVKELLEKSKRLD